MCVSALQSSPVHYAVILIAELRFRMKIRRFFGVGEGEEGGQDKRSDKEKTMKFSNMIRRTEKC